MSCTNNQPKTVYQFCPIGGIVCSKCNYPVTTCYGYVRGIAMHENNNKNHTHLLDYDSRAKINAQFTHFINELASRMVAAMPNEIEMQRNLLEFMDSEKREYPSSTSTRVKTEV
jgi:hypothetical protein